MKEETLFGLLIDKETLNSKLISFSSLGRFWSNNLTVFDYNDGEVEYEKIEINNQLFIMIIDSYNSDNFNLKLYEDFFHYLDDETSILDISTLKKANLEPYIP